MGNSDESRAGRALIFKGAQMGVTKLLYLGGTLILGHLLTPNDFGLVAIATVAIVTVMTATDTGMTTALVQSTERDPAIYDVAWTIGLLRGVLVTAVLLVTAPIVGALFGDERAVYLVRLMAFMPLIASLASPRLADMMRELKFASLAVVAIIAVAIELGLSIALAHWLGGEAIILGKLAGAASSTVTSYLIAPYRPGFRFSYSLARPLVTFGRWMFAIGLTAVAGDLFLKVVISRQLGVAALGLFSLADRLAETPSQLAGEATGAVAFPLYARLRHDVPRLTAALKAHLIGLCFFLLPATVLIAVLAQPLQQRILGEAWAGAPSIIVLLAIGYAAEVSFIAVGPLLKAVGAGRQLFGIELLQYVALIASVYLLAFPLGLAGAGIARIIASVVLFVAVAHVARTAFGFKVPAFMRSALTLILLGAIASGLAWLCTWLIAGVVGVVIAVLAGGGLFLLLAWVTDRPLNIGVQDCLAVFFPVIARKRDLS